MDLRYPIGRFHFSGEVTPEQREQWIQDVEAAPALFFSAVAGLSDEQLDTPYREGGWTVRQVVHHVADSHMNSYIRCKLALTEDEPIIKPYDESSWAKLADSRLPVELSLQLIEAIHERWATLLRSMAPETFARTFRHPHSGVLSLDQALGDYVWHGRHHRAQITTLRQRMGW